MLRWTLQRRAEAGFLMAVLAVGLGGAAWRFGQPVRAAVRDHPYFAITRWEISGHGPLLTEHAVRSWLAISEGTSLWDASPRRIRARLEAHPMIARAVVRREFPDRIEIRLCERRPAAIVMLDDLYYADRSGTLFGPLAPADSRDYPIITGLTVEDPVGYRTWVLRRAIRVVRRCEREACFGGVSGVHLDPALGPVLYPTAPRVPIVLGWGSAAEKLRRAMRVVEEWAGATGRLAKVDVHFRNQVVVELRDATRAALQPSGRRGVRI